MSCKHVFNIKSVKEEVRRFLEYEKNHPAEASPYVDGMIRLCSQHGLHKLQGTLLQTLCNRRLNEVNRVIAKDQTTTHYDYFDKGALLNQLGILTEHPYYIMEGTPPDCFSQSVLSYLESYKISHPKHPESICEAIKVAVNNDLESHLKLDELLTTEECTAVVHTLGMKASDWSCCHMQYLIEKSEIPGSGAAKTLDCNLSGFDWKIILTKEDFNTDLMELLCSLNAQISDEVLQNIVTSVDDRHTKVLQFALNEVKKSLSKQILNSLCSKTLKKKKTKFCSLLITHGAELQVAEVLKEFSPTEIIRQETFCMIIKQNKKSCNDFLQYCLRSGDRQAVKYCKTAVQETGKDSIDMAGLLLAATQSNRDKQMGFNFIEWLLNKKHLNPNEITGQTSPIEVVLKNPCENQSEVCYLLVTHGANVHKTKLSEQDRALLLEQVARIALTSRDDSTLKVCKGQILSLQHPININTFFPFFSRSEVVIFIKFLLHNDKVDFCKSERMNYPLDAALELHICSKLKTELLCLLLENGAQIKCCDFPKKEKSSFLCIATQLAIESGNTKLASCACQQLFKEIEDLDESSKNEYIINSNKETPFHIVMARKESPITLELCNIFSKFPINPNLTDIHHRTPGQRKNDSKKNARNKRHNDKRYKILAEAGKKFARNPKNGYREKKINNASPLQQANPKCMEVGYDEPKKVVNTKKEVEAVKLTVDEIYTSIKEELDDIKKEPASYFTPPVDYQRQNSKLKEQKPPSRQVSADDDVASADTLAPQSPTKEIPEEPTFVPPEIKLDDEKQFENCTWEVECTESVKKYLANKKTSPKWKKAIITKVKQIATDGIQHNHHLCGVLGENLYETRFSKGGRVIWEVAIQFSPRLTAKETIEGDKKQYVYTEVMRLWAIVPDHDNLERELKKIENSRSRGQTAAKPIPLNNNNKSIKRSNKRFPQYYVCCESDISENFGITKCYPAGSTKADEYNIITFYSVNNIFEKSILGREDARKDFPFKEWPKEHDIINMPEGKQSILLLGRSGTGKTTCCLYRMWNQFHSFWSSENNFIQHKSLEFLKSEKKIDMQEVLAKYDGEDESSEICTSDNMVTEIDQKHESAECLHQLFITKNYVLCSQMKKRFYDLAAGSTVSTQHMQFEDEDIPKSLCDVDDHAFPLFLTARQFFIILDNSLKDGNNFFQRDDMGNMKEKILSSDYDHEDPDTLLDLEESGSEVEYDEEFDDDIDFKKNPTHKKKPKERREVTASYFTNKIWPKISKSASVNAKLDPLLVWMEIKSFIKGSQNAVERDEGYLHLQEYTKLGKKMAANYAEQRQDIYKLFEDYKKYMQNCEEDLFDDCELVNNLYSRLSSLDDLPWSIHSIYVDEVQDFTQAELSILLRICRNPNNLFLTGDTAQSIMRGISFRFGDLRYLFHCAKERISINKKNGLKITVPKITDLQTNFRSHTGVLNLAASIIDVMKKCFPSSFDRLPGDEGMFTGPTPIVLESSSISDLALVMHTNKRESSKKIEFGAHQVIIVQSEEAKQNLPDVLKSSIVLTVFESKGLEFDDVLLFDFFKYSQVKDEWRVVTAYINEEEEKNAAMHTTSTDTSPFGKSRPLAFDDNQHKLLNSELKYLYTAITRARCNLWIYDSDELNRRPVFDYWHRRKLIKVIKVDDVTVQDESTLFASTSTREEWKAQGDYFKKKRLWEPAMKCYQRAHCMSLEYEAMAFSTVQQARKPNIKAKEIQEFYLTATKYFLESNKINHSYQCLENAAKCLMNAKKYDNASSLFILLGLKEKALKCYRRTKDHTVLAEIKEQMGKYNDSIRILLKHGNVIKALECADRHESDISPCYKKDRLAHQYVQELLPNDNFKSSEDSNIFFQALGYLPPSEQVDYLKTIKMFEKAYEILAEEQEFRAAYELCMGQGWFEKGFKLAQKEKHSKEKIMFLLFKATNEYHESQCSEETIAQLKKNYGQHTDNEKLCMLVYGMTTNNNAILCRARNFYKNISMEYLEVLNIATAHVEYDNDNHKWKNIQLGEQEDFATIILNACRSANSIKDAFKGAQDINSPLTIQTESFYGFQKDHAGGLYYIPKSSYPWTNEILKNIPAEDLDRNPEGMLKVKFNVVIKAFCDRLEDFCYRWLVEDKLKITEVLCKKLNRFPFHHQLLSDGCVSESCLNRLDKSVNLQAYLDILGSLHDIQELGYKNSPFDVVHVAMLSLSPSVTRYLLIHSSPTGASHQKSRLVLTSKLKQALYQKVSDTLNSSDSTFSLNSWLELWHIAQICQKVHEIVSNLTVRNTEMSYMIQNLIIQSTLVPQYVHQRQTGQHTHLMLIWRDFSEKMKARKVYAASTVCVRSFLLPIISNPFLRGNMSVSNFLNVSTIQAVTILMMKSICSIHNRKPGIIYIPQSYSNVVRIFITHIGGEDIFESCKEDTLRSRKEALQEIKTKLFRLLRLLLQALIGKHNPSFNLLQKTTTDSTCLLNNEAEHCLVLVLTLIANMGLDDAITDSDLNIFHQHIVQTIKTCAKLSIRQAHDKIATCATLNNLFGIIKSILEPFRDNLQCLNIYFSPPSYNIACETKQAKLEEISQRRLIPLSQNEIKESKAVEIKESKLRPTAKEFVPSWLISKSSKSSTVSQEVTDSIDEVELDEINIALPNQDNLENDIEEEDRYDTDSFIISGICETCGIAINTVLQNESSTSAENRAKILEHCRTEQHQRKKNECEKFKSEMIILTSKKAHLSEVASECKEQYRLSRQDKELKIVIEEIQNVLKEFDTEQEMIRNSAEWREGHTTMEIIAGKIESLTMRGEREFSRSKESMLRLKKEQEEEDKKEDEEESQIDDDDLEPIPNTNPNSGESDKKKKRSARNKKNKAKRKK